MFRRFSINFAVFSILLDLGVVLGSLALADYIRPGLNNFGVIKDVGLDADLPVELYPIFGFIWIGVFLFASIYDGRKNYRVIEELSSLSWAILLSSIASAGVLYLSYREVSRALFLSFVLITGVTLTAWRIVYRWWLRNNQSQNGRRRVMIIGTGDAGKSIYSQISSNPTMGLQFVGYLGEVKDDKVIGDYSQVREMVSEEQVDDVVIALPQKDNRLVGDIVTKLVDIPVKIWVVPDYYSLALYKARIEEYAGITMLDLRAPALNEYQRMIKRVLDLVCSILLLPLMIPLMIFIGILIFIFDPGPILFNQERAGENGKPFTMHKFRSMVVSAEHMRHELNSKIKNRYDKRITVIGRFLRRFSLDEVPQIFNVIKGDMSFVGPRPELLDLVNEYEPWQRARFAVPPGITGWWQVNGRSDRPMHHHTEDDIYYLNNYSIWLDIQIVVKTIWVVLIGRGAY